MYMTYGLLVTSNCIDNLALTSVLANCAHVAVMAAWDTAPALLWRCRVVTLARGLDEVDALPVGAIGNAGKEFLVLRITHGINGNIEMPRLAENIFLSFKIRTMCKSIKCPSRRQHMATYLRSVTSVAVAATSNGALIDDLEDQSICSQSFAGVRHGSELIANATRCTRSTSSRNRRVGTKSKLVDSGLEDILDRRPSS